MSTKDTIFMSIGDANSAGLPYLFEPENLGLWPNEHAKSEVMTTITAILKRRFEGVAIETHRLSGERTLWKLYVNPETPEGRTLPVLLQLARVGQSLPTAQVISILENAYRLNELELPSDSGSAN